nr:exocyst complex component EXO70H1-like [Tanacetum cinerariifolium]
MSTSSHHRTFSATMMEEDLLYAEEIIKRRDLDSSSYTKLDYLFSGDKREAREFVKSVKRLQSVMHFFVSESASSVKIIHAQKLMQVAMKRLEKEFYRILSSNRDYLDSESVSNRSSRARSSVSDDDNASEEDDTTLSIKSTKWIGKQWSQKSKHGYTLKRSQLNHYSTKETLTTPIHSGGIHPLTHNVMNYLVFLSDYNISLSDILADWPIQVQSPLPDSYFSSDNLDELLSISARFAWLVLVLLCAELYKDVAQSYLFLVINLNYVVSKVNSSNLRDRIGDDWLVKHGQKVKQYAGNYERMAWSKVILSLPENPIADGLTNEAARNSFRRFNLEFNEAYKKQSSSHGGYTLIFVDGAADCCLTMLSLMPPMSSLPLIMVCDVAHRFVTLVILDGSMSSVGDAGEEFCWRCFWLLGPLN